jgi:hypothetical protein
MAAAEQKKSYAVIKQFRGLNTRANRTAIEQEEFAWIENAMPIGFGNIKIVPAQAVLTSGWRKRHHGQHCHLRLSLQTSASMTTYLPLRTMGGLSTSS